MYHVVENKSNSVAGTRDNLALEEVVVAFEDELQLTLVLALQLLQDLFAAVNEEYCAIFLGVLNEAVVLSETQSI